MAVLTFALIFSGISVVLSLFMIIVAVRASRRGGMRIFRYLAIAFIFILLPNFVFVLSELGRGGLQPLVPIAFTFCDFVILVLFYGAMVRGT